MNQLKMRLIQTLKRSMVGLSICLALGMSSALAELEITDQQVTGSFTTKDSVLILVDMPLPEPFPEALIQSKLSPLAIDKRLAQRALDSYALPTGVLNHKDSGRISGQSLHYMQPDYKHHGANRVESSTLRSPAGEDPQLQQAQQVVKGFLDALQITGYEYPFYACKYDYQMDDRGLRPFSSQEEYIRYQSIGLSPRVQGAGGESQAAIHEQRTRKNLEKYELLGRPATEVIVRFTLHGLPFYTMNSWSPGQSGITGDGNPTPFARFVVTKEGKIAFAFIRFWFQEERSQPDTQPLLSWQETLTQGLTIPWEEYHAAGQENQRQLTVRGIEPLLSVDEKGITFPLWRVVLEENQLDMRRDFPGYPDHFYYYTYSFTFDAHTGVQR